MVCPHLFFNYTFKKKDMAYNGRSYSGGRGYGGRGYSSNAGYTSGGYGDNGGRGYGGRQKSKRSGAKYISKAANGKACIVGWKASRQGIISIVAQPTTKGMVSEQSEHWVVKVKVGYANPYLTTGFYNVNSRRLVIPDMGFVANPSAPNGGYFGTFKRK